MFYRIREPFLDIHGGHTDLSLVGCHQVGGMTMDEHPRSACRKGVVTLGEERDQHAGQQIPHAAGSHPRIAASVDCDSAVRSGDDSTRPLRIR